MKFSIIEPDEIAEGLTTDVYFLRTEEVLRSKGVNPRVAAEVTVADGEWGVVCGLNDVAELLQGKPLNVYAMPEGSIFFPREPVLSIEGRYLDFARYETPILGFLCYASGVATKAARIKLAAGSKKVISFGTRRMHPALAAVIERAAYIGGMDGVSNVAGAKKIGIEPMGTMPHALIICFGDQARAFKAFDEVMPENVPRICLCDTFADEKTEAIIAIETLGKNLHSVRLDTPSSRRGDFRKIIEEVRWELDARGGKHVEILVSGGIDENEIRELRDVVDGFGVGTSVSSARTIDFALDIVEVEGRICAKRGKLGGRKQVYRNWRTLDDEVRLARDPPPRGKVPLLEPMIRNGKVVMEFSVEEARNRVLRQLKVLRRKYEV